MADSTGTAMLMYALNVWENHFLVAEMLVGEVKFAKP
jgi:hypothetical protein